MNYFKLSATPKQMAHLASILIADGCTVGETPALVPAQESPHLYPPSQYPESTVVATPVEPGPGEPVPQTVPSAPAPVTFDPLAANHYSRRSVAVVNPITEAVVQPLLSYAGLGIEATGVYDAVHEVLGVTVSKKPWFLALAHLKEALVERLGPA